MKGLGRILYYGYMTAMVAWLVFPILLIVAASFQGGLEISANLSAFTLKGYKAIPPRYWQSLWLSVNLAFWAATISLLIATPAAWAMVRGKVPGRQFFSNLVLVPIIVPKLVLGIALLRLFLPMGLANTTTGLLIALVGANSLPVALRYVEAVVEGVDATFEDAALSLGANRLTVFWKIVVPLVGPGIIVSSLFIFMNNLLAFLLVFFIAGPKVSPISIRLFADIIEQGILPQGVAMSALLIAIFALFYILVSVVLGPKYLSGAVFSRRDV